MQDYSKAKLRAEFLYCRQRYCHIWKRFLFELCI